jgi:MoxR-like ATPase
VDLLEKAPTCLDKDQFEDELESYDESTLLQHLNNNLRQEGLIFSPRVIDAFHTSLKCHDINPITVLAGVSGTGKTLLPMRYATMMGMHRLVLAVQPRWDSPQDMFGFYNYLEKEYKATELSRALVRMDPFNYKDEKFSMLDSDWAKDRMLLVLLDEMNLARTEYYFSEFLSRLELRREVKNPSVSHERSQAEIELDVGPGKYPFRIWVGHNVFFVGTLNEDETTQTLSDKVLDRANVIRFGKPDEKAKAAKNNTQIQALGEKYLSFSQWSSWHRELDEGVDWYEEVVKWIQRLNAALDRVGRPFGFRVQQAIGQYVANYPNVVDRQRYRLAFADQVEQKIIPKLRGIDLGDVNANECLSDLEAVIADLGDDELGDAFYAARTESENLGMFQWRGVTRKVE